ncbi:hypothetical protein Lal_00023941 [Lupinus albus]|uniref:Uncharacterized protein n=1 Tax=Lupinus albus TaxID=3870 RepID=A0A6A4PI87_LUPAL|nr:hypothetical protein Lalb_Chr13g0294691 [Lupinus albus]KAF1887933.1 hypothetical protein Lal_00023941 [Lupinus albus]
MASTINIVSTLLFLCFISQGYGLLCSFNDISIKQSQTGAKIKGKPEWFVSITNKCDCVQVNVKLNCQGFQTVQKIDPSILMVLGNDECLLNFGNALYNDPITFKYAWDKPFPLNPVSSELDCYR